MKKSPLNKRGPKTDAWDLQKRKLKLAFMKAGITRCEVGGSECLGGVFLQWAHAKKRRNVKPWELGVVALACQCCHAELDLLPEEEMHEKVMAIIKSRSEQPVAIPDSAWTY